MINFEDLGAVRYLLQKARAAYYALEEQGAAEEILEIYGDVILALEGLMGVK